MREIGVSSWKSRISTSFPTREATRFRICGKLSPSYLGPFEVLDKKGDVAFR